VLENKFYQAYKDQGDGFIVLQLIAENYNGATPSQSDLQDWVQEHGLTFPVMADPNWQVGGPYGNNSIPFYWVVDQNLVIQKKGNFLFFFHFKIRELLGID